jgi:peptidyl-prolyl cis-trans isomerase B (cyclophilin B)
MPDVLKRSLAGVPALLLLSLVVTGCGSNDDTTATDSSSPTTSAATTATTSAPATTEATTADASGPCSYPSDGTGSSATPPPAKPAVSGKVPAVIHLNSGDVPITLDAGHAPCTVNSFVSLAKQKFFDDTRCHRLTTSGIYVLQCGDPTGTGTGGPGYSFADETTGHDTYPAGTLAMANAGPDTNGSQFFLCYGDCSGLDSQPNYTVFGSISKPGMRVLAAIAKKGSTPPGDGTPNAKPVITSVTVG